MQRIFLLILGLALLCLTGVNTVMILNTVEYWTMPKAVILGGITLLGLISGGYLFGKNIKYQG